MGRYEEESKDRAPGRGGPERGVRAAMRAISRPHDGKTNAVTE